MGEPARDTRERILDAALRVVTRDGVRQLTSSNVAREAGLRQSHLTYYFPTSRALREAVMQRTVGAMLGHLRAVSGKGPREGLKLVHRLVTDPDHMRLFAGLATEAEADEELRTMFRDALDGFEAVLAELLDRPKRDPALQRLLATLWGLGLRRLLTREKPPAGEVDALLEALASAPARKRRS